jgi:hypothetical protein
MRRIVRHRPSPAMVVACLALVIALGGTSYAAVILPKNSVGTAQLKRGAVTGPKVKARTLGAAHFSQASFPPGRPGPRAHKGRPELRARRERRDRPG